MADTNAETPPVRGAQHDALSVFLGRWAAEGTSFGIAPAGADPRSAPTPWVSTHTAWWHTGQFFLVQDERANPGSDPFDTLSVMGVDANSGQYFARCFENHGFYRHYDVSRSGRVWTFSGETERVRIEFSADGRRQTIAWEWRPKGQWLPLCDRVAVRQD